jgi:tRNA threonylcarbamoyladenosine biosynthesis protein TsaE
MNPDPDLHPLRCETAGAPETEALGARLATRLKAGDVVLVRGEMGAGKTTLVRGVARALGVSTAVTSPTFSIGHRYPGRGVNICHLDLYRIALLSEQDPALLDDYFDAQAITLVEWPEPTTGELYQAGLLVTLEHLGGERRGVEVEVLSLR